MSRKHRTWFVVADGSRARFLTRSGDGTYRAVVQFESAEARTPSHELGSGRPSRVQESANAARHAIQPRTDLHANRKISFAREIAAHLNDASDRGEIDAIVLYTDKRSLAAIRGALSPETRRRIKAQFAKDLTKVPVAKLARHFEAP